MARFILLTIIIFIALTFAMTFLKGLLRRAFNSQVQTNNKTDATSSTTKQKELYNKNGVIVMKDESNPPSKI